MVEVHPQQRRGDRAEDVREEEDDAEQMRSPQLPADTHSQEQGQGEHEAGDDKHDEQVVAQGHPEAVAFEQQALKVNEPHPGHVRQSVPAMQGPGERLQGRDDDEISVEQRRRPHEEQDSRQAEANPPLPSGDLPRPLAPSFRPA